MDISFSCLKYVFFFFFLLHLKQMISLLSSSCFFLNLVSLRLEECWSFPFFLIIYLNFLDIKGTSLLMNPLELLSKSSNSAIYTFRALDELFLSSHLELVSLVLRVIKFLFFKWSMVWRWTLWTLRIPNSSS